MSLQDLDRQGKTVALQPIFADLITALKRFQRCKPTDANYAAECKAWEKAKLDFLKKLNKFVKAAEGVGETHLKINWKKLFSDPNSGSYNPIYQMTLQKTVDTEQQKRFGGCLQQIGGLMSYKRRVTKFIDEKLDSLSASDFNMRGHVLEWQTLNWPINVLKSAFGNHCQIYQQWTSQVRDLFSLVVADNAAPRQIQQAKTNVRAKAGPVFQVLKERIPELKEEAERIYTSSQKVAAEKAARYSNELLKKIKDAKKTPSNENIAAVAARAGELAPKGLKKVAGRLTAALSSDQNKSGNNGSQRKRISVKRFRPKITTV